MLVASSRFAALSCFMLTEVFLWYKTVRGDTISFAFSQWIGRGVDNREQNRQGARLVILVYPVKRNCRECTA